MFQEGQQIGSYTLLRKLGKGGFGEVWLAEKRSQFVTKKVAVKLPLDEQVNLDAIRQEAELWEQASGHANVLPIIDADIVDGQVVIVSEYADGGSLYDKLKREGKLSVKQSVEMTVGILSGLDFLHNRKIIHRDIKPQNILLQGETPRLADFGISRAMQTAAISSTIIGTDAYMSPEAFDGKRSVQTDIWAVGVVIYQLLTGNLPFPQDHPTERMFAVLMKDFEALPDNIPQELQKIIKTALAKNPSERFQAAAAMSGDLKDFLHTISSPVRKSPPLPTVGLIQPEIKQNISQSEENVYAETIQTMPQAFRQPQVETVAFKTKKTQPEKTAKPKSYTKFAVIISLVVLLFAGFSTAGYFIYQKTVSVYKVSNLLNFDGLSKQDMELLLEDANPSMLKKLKEDPEIKKQQIASLKQLFALASQAIKDGYLNEEKVKKEIENIRIETTAANYDKEINKDKGSMPPFSFIGEDRIKKFWEDTKKEAEFKEFLDIKMEFVKESGQTEKDFAPTEDDIKQAKEYFAKTRIYYAEAQEKSKPLSEKFYLKNELSIKLQQASYLSRRYAEKVLAEKTKATDEEIKNYIAKNPDHKGEAAEKVKEQKEKQIMDKILADNPIKIAEDFQIRQVSDEEIQKSQQQMPSPQTNSNQSKNK